MYHDENYAEQFLDDEVIKALNAQGLDPIVCFDEFSDDIREGRSSTWVGIDTDTRLDIVDKGNCFDDYVANYCKVILNCTVDDIVWSTVYKYEHSGICFNLTGFNCRWDSGIHGFIYMTKEQVRNEYGVKRVSQKLYDRVIETFEKEVKAYSKYINHEYYAVTLKSENDEDDFVWYGGCSTSEHIIEAINDMLAYTDYTPIPNTNQEQETA